MKNIVDVIVPLYNESEVFENLINRLNGLNNQDDLLFRFILVDDGSTDGTSQKLEKICKLNKKYSGIFLSRNFGHQTAVTAGLHYSKSSDFVLIIDADLQDPPELINKMLELVNNGYEVVYGIRKNRKENFFLKLMFTVFYRLLNILSMEKFPVDAGDFSLITRQVADALNNMPEESRYLRGMRSWVGFNQIGISYDRDERTMGKSKYSFKKYVKLALDGIFNFSQSPIRFIFLLGSLTFIASLFYFIYTLFKKFVLHEVPDGFTATIFLIILFGGVQLMSLGIIGEYVLKIFFQVKNRPLFVVKSEILNNSQ